MMNFQIPQLGGFSCLPMVNSGLGAGVMMPYNTGLFNNFSLLGGGALGLGADQVNLSGESSGLLGAAGTSTTGTTNAAAATTGTAAVGTAVGDSTANFIAQMIAKLSTSTNAIASQLLSSTGSAASTGTSSTGTSSTAASSTDTSTGRTGTAAATNSNDGGLTPNGKVPQSSASTSVAYGIAKEMTGYKWQYGNTGDVSGTESAKAGNCYNLAKVAIAKFKEQGITAQLVHGNLNCTDYNGGHYWLKYQDPSSGQWIFFDPTACATNHSAERGFLGCHGTYSGASISNQ